jgi:DNA invertase Pin-like site-specific DNA recombinase
VGRSRSFAAVEQRRASPRFSPVQSTRDLLNILAAVAGRRAGFRSLGDAWADTTTAHGRLMLTVLGGLAEFERELIRARTGEDRRRARRAA